MELHLIRHGCAGRKDGWRGPDADRPLDPAGVAQAQALCDHLLGVPLRRLLSSPARRCIDTLAPIAAERQREIEHTPELLPGADPEVLLRRLADPSLADAALCTHGETLTGLLPLLRDAGTAIAPDGGDDGRLLVKGSLWTLTVEPGRSPQVVALRHVIPSPVTACAEHAGHGAWQG